MYIIIYIVQSHPHLFYYPGYNAPCIIGFIVFDPTMNEIEGKEQFRVIEVRKYFLELLLLLPYGIIGLYISDACFCMKLTG